MIVGIDLGTTNSLVAVFTADGVKMIPNGLGKNLTPSIVAYEEDGTILVGETAREYGELHPTRVASVFKRSMGTEKKYRLGEKEFLSEELSAFVLKVLKESAESFLGEPVEEAVISVPAYFDENRRKATKRAGELAGLRVDRIISEPTAAAIAYGLYEKTKNTRFLVFDLGGGTFDVSILELFQNILEVRAVAGDNYLGGEDFTEIIVRKFMEKNDLYIEDFTEKEYAQLRRACEEAKKRFCEEGEVEITSSCSKKTGELKLSLREYEKLCEPLLEKIRKPVQRSLQDAHVKLNEIDEIVMVGGATRLPVVRDFIIRQFKKFPSTNLNPDEAIAIGAAIQAAMKERREEVKEVILTDVCSFTLGTEVSVQSAAGLYEAGHFCPIIERNTVIPASHTETLYTLHDNQDKVLIKVLQGESRFANNNLYLGELEISVPKGPAGKEAVEVTYTYDINSLLEVQAKVVSTGVEKKIYIKGNGNDMSLEEMKRRMEELSYLKIQPRDQEENRLPLLRAERLYEEATSDDRKLLEVILNEFEATLKRGNREEIVDARRTFLEHLEEIEARLR